MGDILDTPVSLELVLAQLKVKEQYCKELEDSQKSLQQQVQELLQESNVTKSNLSRKERQWEEEEARLTSQLGVANMELMEKGTLVKQLEKDLGMARSAVEQLQSKSSEAERWKERELLENQRLQADLADSRLAIQELEKNCSLKDEAVAKQRQLLEDFSKKMEAQKKQLEKLTEESTKKSGQLEEMEHEHRTATEKLNENSKQLRSLKEDYEKLHLAHRELQSERTLGIDDVLRNLEDSEGLREEQKVKLGKLEKELRKVKNQVKQLETRCASAEADAKSKSASLTEALSKLETTTSSITELAGVKVEVNALKETLVQTEKDLAQEMAMRFAAESALGDYKKREEHLLKVEEGHSELKGMAKWRNEQFESLEEAFTKLRSQFKGSKSEWEAEKAQMVKEIDCLRDRLESKVELAKNLHTQVDMLRQALDHEHIHQKGLEQELTEAKAAMGTAVADCKKARLAFELICEETSAKIAMLNQYAAAREKELKEAGLTVSPLVDGEKTTGKVVSNMTIACKAEDIVKLRRVVQDAESCLASKDARLQELGIELTQAKSFINNLEDPDVDCHQQHVITEQKVFNESPVGACDKQEALTNHDSDLQHQVARIREQETQILDLQTQCQNLQIALSLAEERVPDSKIPSKDMQVELLRWKRKLEDEQAKNLELIAAVENVHGELQRWKERVELVTQEGKVTREQEMVRCREQETKILDLQTRCQNLQKALSLAEDGVHVKNQVESSSKEMQGESLGRKQKVEGEKAKTAQFKAAVQTLEGDLEGLKESAELAAEEVKAIREQQIVRFTEQETRILDLETQCQNLQNAETVMPVTREIDISLKELEAELLVWKGKVQDEQNSNRQLQDAIKNLEGELAGWKEKAEMAAQESRTVMEQQMVRFGAQETRILDRETQCQNLPKALSLAEEGSPVQKELEMSLKGMQVELLGWKGKVEDEQTKTVQLQAAIQNLEGELEEWQRRAEVTAQEGRVVREQQMLRSNEQETQILDLQTHCQNLQKALSLAEEGITVRRELEISLKKVQVESLGWKAQVEEEQARNAQLLTAIHDLELELDSWKERAELAAQEGRMMREQQILKFDKQETQMLDLQTQCQNLQKALSLAEEAILVKRDLEILLKDMQVELLGWKAKVEDNQAKNLHLKATVENLEGEFEKWKEIAEMAAKEGKVVRDEFENSISGLRAELGNSKDIAAKAKDAEEKLRCEFGGLVKELRVDVEVWKNNAKDGEASYLELQNAMDNLQVELAGWKERAAAGVDGEKNMRMSYEASLIKLQEELGAAKMNTSAVTEENLRLKAALESMKVEVAGWKDRMEVAAREGRMVRDELENAISDLRGELEDSKDIAAKVKYAEQELRGEFDRSVKELQMDVEVWKSTASNAEARQLELQNAVENLQVELAGWKERAAAGVDAEKNMRMSYEASLIKLQEELGAAKMNTSAVTEENLRLKAALESMKVEVAGWKDRMEVAAKEGRMVRDELENAISDLRGELEDSKDIAAKVKYAEQELRVEFDRSVKELQMDVEVWKSTASNAEARQLELQNAVENLQVELAGWKERAAAGVDAERKMKMDYEASLIKLQEELGASKINTATVAEENLQLKVTLENMKVEVAGWKDRTELAAKEGRMVRDELENSISGLRAELEDSKDIAEKVKYAEQELRGEFDRSVKELQMDVEVWKSTASNVEARHLELQNAVENLQVELAGWKEKAAAAVDEERITKTIFEASLVKMQEEVKAWKEKAEESERLQAGFAVSMAEIEVELFNWKRKATLADTEGKLVKAELELMKVEVCQAKEIAETEAAKIMCENQILKKCLKDAEHVLQDHVEKMLAAAEENKRLQSELQQAFNTIKDLTSQLDYQKAKEANVEKLTQQLEFDLKMAQEEALVRKEKMLCIFAQLESTRASQKELLAQLQSQRKQLLDDDALVAAVCSMAEQKDAEILLKNMVQRYHPQLGNSSGLVMENKSLEEEAALLRERALESQHDIHRLKTDLDAALNDLSVKNSALSELHCEVSKLKLVLTQLGYKNNNVEELLQEVNAARSRDQADDGMEGAHCRNGSVKLQQVDLMAPGSPPRSTGNPTSQAPLPSPRSGSSLMRKRNTASPLQVKSSIRVYSNDTNCKILEEVDNNSNALASGPRSPVPLSMSRKCR